MRCWVIRIWQHNVRWIRYKCPNIPTKSVGDQLDIQPWTFQKLWHFFPLQGVYILGRGPTTPSWGGQQPSVLGIIPSKQQFGKTGLPRLQPQILGALLHSIQDSGRWSFTSGPIGFNPPENLTKEAGKSTYEWVDSMYFLYLNMVIFQLSC